MKVLVAPASFKGSYSPGEAAALMARVLNSIRPEWQVERCPLVDGGEGSLDALNSLYHGTRTLFPVNDHLGHSLQASVLVFEQNGKRTAMLESAEVLGFARYREKFPWESNSYGLGQLLKYAREETPQAIWVGLGGTATVDGGLGLLAALGLAFLSDGKPIVKPRQWHDNAVFRGGAFSFEGKLLALVDVQNPLLGPQGAAMFMPQKGISGAALQPFELMLQHMAKWLDPDQRHLTLKGAGAAGGLGFCLACLGFKLVSGSDLWAELCGLKEHISQVDMVIGGEGRFDLQTEQGKPLNRLQQLCQALAKPLFVAVGEAQCKLDYGSLGVLGGEPPFLDFEARLRKQFALWFGV